jgi:hypothetical protein
MLQELINQLPPLIAFIESKHDLPEFERATYLGVIASFEPVLQMSMPPCVDNRELRFLFFWPLHLQADFLSLLRQRNGGAIAIVMYYCTIIFVSQSRYFFMEGWGEQLMRACLEVLDQDWLSAVRWPASFINHNPTWGLFSNLAHMRHGTNISQQYPTQASSAHPKKRAVEVPYRQYAAIPSPPHETRDGREVVPYSQQPGPPQNQHSQTITYAPHSKRPESTDEAR